jgi:hypothetical protein
VLFVVLVRIVLLLRLDAMFVRFILDSIQCISINYLLAPTWNIGLVPQVFSYFFPLFLIYLRDSLFVGWVNECQHSCDVLTFSTKLSPLAFKKKIMILRSSINIVTDLKAWVFQTIQFYHICKFCHICKHVVVIYY